jgi:hypothetical protein
VVERSLKIIKMHKIAGIVFLYMKMLDCFIKQPRLHNKLARSMWYMPMHLAASELGGSLYCFSLFEGICLFYKTSLLACNHFQIGGGAGGVMIAFYG